LNAPEKTTTVDCLGLGIIPLDFLVQIPRFPEPGGKVDADSLCVQGGGPIPNCMVGLRRLGLKTAVVAVVGDDMAGKISIEELRRERIDTRHIIVKKQPSATAYGFIEPEGRRTIALHRKIGIAARDLKLDTYPIPRLVHLDGRDIEATVKLARWAKKVGAVVSFDIGSVRNDVTSVLPLVDHLVVADAWAFPFTGARSIRKALQRLHEITGGTVVITEGTRGASALERAVFDECKAYKVHAVDTTGAGDAFHVGYIYALLKGMDMPSRLRYGSATAALKCTRPGARGGMPTLSRLNRFLKGNPVRYA